MGDIARQGDQEVNIVDRAKQISVTTTTDGSKERLDVDAKSDSTPNPRPGRSFAAFVENAGSKDMNVDGSTTPVTFLAVPATGKKLFIHTISLIVEDQSINFLKFGGITALTNGVDIKLKEAGLAEETLGNFKKNSDFYVFANVVLLEAAATDVLHIQFEVKRNNGTTFQLNDSNGEFFKVVINDNLTAIDRFNLLIRGYEVDE